MRVNYDGSLHRPQRRKKVRRSLLAVSIITIFICNMQLTASTLNILGLELVFDQDRLVAFGQIASGLLLLIFVFKSAPLYLSSLQDMESRRLARQEKSETDYLVKMRDDIPFVKNTDSGDVSPQNQIDHLQTRFAMRRGQIEQKYTSLITLMGAFTILLVDFGVPLVIGTVAAFEPSVVSLHIDQMIAENPSKKVIVDESAELMDSERRVRGSAPLCAGSRTALTPAVTPREGAGPPTPTAGSPPARG